MTGYNIYYLNRKINNRPINEEELNKIKSSGFISKFDIKSNTYNKIDIKNLHIIKCYIF